MSYFDRADATNNQTSATVTKSISPDGVVLVQVGAADYTPLRGETVVEFTDTAAARALTMPKASALPPGTELTVKDGSGLAATNNITVKTAGLTPDVDQLLWQQVAAGSDLGTVVAASAAALPACTAAGTGVGKTLTGNANGAVVVDGVTPNAADAVLIKDQANPVDNGLYTVTTVGDAGTPFVLTRKTTFDQVAEVLPGSVASISAGGTVNASLKFALRGGLDGAKTKVISTAFGKVKYYNTGRDWRQLI